MKPGAQPPSKLPESRRQQAPEDATDARECRCLARGWTDYVLHARVNFVEVPFTVKDSKGRLVPGLTWRDVRVYENGLRQQLISLFTDEAFPLSVALVIDQSMTTTRWTRVNDALGALQDAFTPYDEVSVITYNNGAEDGDRLYRGAERAADAGDRAFEGFGARCR
jgi:hypothetical protein